MSKLIAVVGMAGSGKSIATDYLEKKGWNKIYFGGAIMDKLKEEGKEVTPANEKKCREDIRAKHGMAAVAVLLEEKIKKAYGIECFIKIDNNDVKVVAIKDNHDVTLANNIMKTIQSEFSNKVYVTVKFEK